jgi:diadenosine tetraphosphatase ApaH/serine/threonine PP2A family protein phosphatase
LEILADNRKHEEAIEKWMLTIVDDGGVRRFDDLHIDKIDPAWKHRSRWVTGGLEAFRVTKILRDRNGLLFTVALAFSLTCGSRPRGIDFRNRKELEERLDSSPPSLYLFHRGEEPRNRMAPGNPAQNLSPSTFAVQPDALCYYLEFRQKNTEEYCRSVFVEG